MAWCRNEDRLSNRKARRRLFASQLLRCPSRQKRPSVEGIVDEGIAGTSSAAAAASGAALLARDYFAQGYYPSGSGSPSNRIQEMSGALIRSLLSGSANFLSAFVNALSRFNNEQGYGRIELTSMFPLAHFPGGPVPGDPRQALRPNDGGSP